MNEQFDRLLTTENARKAAELLAENFESKEDRSQVIEYDFTASSNDGLAFGEPDTSTNTWFKMDTQDATILREVRDMISNPELEITEEMVEQFQNWLDEVKKSLLRDHADTLRSQIRKEVLGGEKNAPEENFPLETIVINSLEIVDLPTYITEKGEKVTLDWLLKIYKNEDIYLPTNAVSKDIFDEFIRTGDDPSVIVKNRQRKNHPSYENVMKVEKIKSSYEINLDLYVDYNFCGTVK
jgi:hypothetical protein